MSLTSGLTTKTDRVRRFMDLVRKRNPHEPEFLQAVQEVAESVLPLFDAHPEYRQQAIMDRLVEPERVIMFRVPWTDDQGHFQVNRGFRVQMNSAIGPYKGGIAVSPIGEPEHSEIPGL